MPFSFPASPSVGQTSAQNGRTYIYVGSNAWELTGNVSGHASSHAAAGADPLTLSVSQVTGLQTALDGKAASSHAHSASDVTSGTLDAARLPLATTTTAGAIIVGSGLAVSSGVLSATGSGGANSNDIFHPFLLMGG
jgi:hypothetical protein